LGTIVGCQTSDKLVAITFDDGPRPASTPTILGILDRHKVRATFFLLGRNVSAYPDIARQVVQAGHAVGNHTFTHPRLVGQSRSSVARELFRCRQAIYGATGVTPKVMRPPFGDQDLTAYSTSRLMGYATVHWSASGDDWQGDTGVVVARRALTGVQPGGIILLHDGWEPSHDQSAWRPEYDSFQDRAPTIEALAIIIEELQAQGYRFVTVPEMMHLAPPVRKTWFVRV
jgi:peptidoglycan/xylan/chitin deacetylase (PgdA/CDA1 family)